MTSMKKNEKIIPYRNRKGRRYPNAAEARYYADKVVDLLLSAATCAGIVVAFAFLTLL